jgi:hypothetical protein
MVDIESKFKQLGIKNMSKKTYITEQNIVAIMNRDFKSLQKTKAFGFINILEKEFDLDLSDWTKEYREYLKENGDGEDKELKKIDQAPKNERVKSLLKVVAISISLVLIVLAWFFYYSNNLELKSSKSSTEDMQNLVKEAKVNLEHTKEMNDSELKIIYEDSNSSSVVEDNSSISEDKNISTPIVKESNSTAIKKSEVVEDESESIAKDELYIQPIYKAWIGVIYLDNREKKSYTTVDKIYIDTDREQLIALGHDKVKLFLNQKEFNFDSDRLRFIYRDGELKTLTFSEFRELNRGRNW